MKYLYLAICLLCISGKVVAQNNDSLLQLFKANYIAERAKGNSMAAMGEASQQTFTVNNALVLGSLRQMKHTDTMGLRLLVNNVINQFLDKEVMELECPGGVAIYKKVFDLYTDAVCKCVTDKVVASTDQRMKRNKDYSVFVKGCAEDVMGDATLVSTIRSVVDNSEKMELVLKGISPYAYSKCPILREEAMHFCINQAKSRYTTDVQQRNQQLQEALKTMLVRAQGDEGRQFFKDDKVYKKTEEALKPTYTRIAALKATQEQIATQVGYDKNKLIITFAYQENAPEIICQMELTTEFKEFESVITSVNVIPGAKVKGQEIFLERLKNMQDMPPPPVMNIK